MPPFHQESNTSDAGASYTYATSSTSASEDTTEIPNTNHRNIRDTTITLVNTFSPRTNSTTTKSERGDAFLRYSNDEVRMQTLMISTTTQRDTYQPAEAQVVERKTRISFELHPSLIIEDMLHELGDDDDDDYDSGNDISSKYMFSSFMQMLRELGDDDDDDDDSGYDISFEYMLSSFMQTEMEHESSNDTSKLNRQ